MSDEELRKLEKEIRDQDQLLTGYQQENERLYDDLKQAQVKAKTAESQMFKENQKLGKQRYLHYLVSLIVFFLLIDHDHSMICANIDKQRNGLETQAKALMLLMLHPSITSL